jgi:hypothetical protein
MMRCLARVPGIRERTATSFPGDPEFDVLRDDARSLYETYQGVLTALQARTTEIEVPRATGSQHFLLTRLYVHYQRLYGIGLTVAIILNCLLRALDPDDDTLELESTYFAQEIMFISESAKAFRPLGSHYMMVCLLTAWVGTRDVLLRATVEKELNFFQNDFDGSTAAEATAEFELKLRRAPGFDKV